MKSSNYKFDQRDSMRKEAEKLPTLSELYEFFEKDPRKFAIEIQNELKDKLLKKSREESRPYKVRFTLNRNGYTEEVWNDQFDEIRSRIGERTFNDNYTWMIIKDESIAPEPLRLESNE